MSTSLVNMARLTHALISLKICRMILNYLLSTSIKYKFKRADSSCVIEFQSGDNLDHPRDIDNT